MKRRCDQSINAFRPRCLRQGRTAEHDHLNAEFARGFDLGIGRGAATILANDHVNAVSFQHLPFGRSVERPASENIGRIRHREWGLDRIDTADEIAMLRRLLEGQKLLTAKRKEHTARRAAQGSDSFAAAVNQCPAVAGNRLPCRPSQRQQRHARKPRRCGSAGRNLRRVGVRRIDYQIDAMFANIGGQPFRSAEAARTCGHALLDWPLGATGKRERNGQRIMRGKFPGQLAGFGGTTEYQDGFAHDVL